MLVTVQDGTKSKDREVTASITVSVIDKPEPPLLSPVAGEPQDSAVSLTWTPGAANGSPITNYKVSWTGAATGEKDCGAVTSCQVTGLKNGKTYSFTVAARNDVGWSKPSTAVEATPDKVPSAPTDVTITGGNKTAKVTWKAPSGDFSAVDNYSVTVTGAGAPQTKETGNTATELSFTFNNNDISDGTAITATVKAHNKINWSAESAASPSEKIWGDPDAPNIALSNDDTTVTAKVTLGNNRNAGCRRISLGGDVKDTIDCSDSGATFDINENDLNTREITVTATVVPQRDASSGTGKSSFVPQYKVQPPTDVYTTGSGSTCTVHWTKQGHAQSYSVTADGIDSGTATNRNSLDFRMSPWAKCNTASVQQVFNGATSDAVTGGPHNGAPYTYEKKAVINKPQELRWSDNAHVINVTGGSVDVYGKSATVQIIINGQPFTWNSGQQLDVTDLAVAADGNYAWSVKVTGGPGYSGLDNTADGGSVAGTRPSDSSEGTKSLKSGTDVTTLAKNPWILGFGNTPISSTTIHKQ